MPKILIHTLGSSGDFNPFVALGFELQKLGHDVHFAVNPANAVKIAPLGFETTAVGPDPDWHSDLFRRLLITSAITPVDILFREMLIPSIVPAYETLVPLCERSDMLVSHTIQLAAPAAAFRTGIKWVSGVPATSCYPTVQQPPPMMAWNNCPESLSRCGWTVAKHIFKPLDALANAEYRKIGAPPRSDVVIGGAYSRLLTVGMWSPAYFPRPTDWPSWMQVGGYGRWDAPHEHVDVKMPSGDGALIVFTLGSSVVNHPGQFFAMAIEAIRGTDWRAILVGAPSDTNLPQDVRTRITIAPYAPYGDIFPKADVVVHQGGVGTTQTACYFGTPAVIVPRGFDQFENAAHLQRNGWGLRLQPRDLSPRLLRRRISRLLTDKGVKSRVQVLGTRMRAESGARGNAVLIDELFKN